MVVLLVIFTFAILLTIGAILEYSKKPSEQKESSPVLTMDHVFAQDGGEDVNNSKNKEEKKEE